MTEVREGLVWSISLGGQFGGEGVLEVDWCLTCAMCLTQTGESFTSPVILRIEEPARLQFTGRGESIVGLPLVRPIPRPHPDWWNRTSVPEKTGPVHYYRDRAGKIVGIQYKSRYYQP